MSKDKKNQTKKEKEAKEKTDPIPNSGKIRLVLPKDLESKIRSESNPDAVAAEALMEFYSERSRSNSIIQKEMDNNIIEIQRRHISDLKEQLEAVNHNYDELMKTYQAYMLQVQPLIERAQLAESEVKKISAVEENESAIEENEPAPLRDETKTVTSDETGSAVVEKTESVIAEKKKKWYEFWKK
jgi:hypothetical protein